MRCPIRRTATRRSTSPCPERVAGLLACSLVAFGLPARAAAAPPAAAPALDAGRPPGAGEAAQPAGAFDFELLPPESPADLVLVSRLETRARVRRSLLQWHQALGIATTLLMAATVVTGQLDYSDRFGGGRSSGDFEGWHTLLEGATTVSFGGDGLLALFAPAAYERPKRGVALTVHEISMAVATAGFLAEVPLGIYTVAREGRIDQPSLALVHLILGYLTGAALATGVGALAF